MRYGLLSISLLIGGISLFLIITRSSGENKLSPKAMTTAAIGVGISVLMFITFECMIPEQTSSVLPQPAITPSPKISSNSTTTTSTNTATQEQLSKIAVQFDFQDIVDGKQKVVVWVTNNSTQFFEGSVSVLLKSATGESKGSDMVFVDKMAPGTKTYAIVWGKLGASNAKYEASGIFTDPPTTQSTVKYEIVYSQPGNNYITLFIKVSEWSKENLIEISKYLKTKYPSDSILGFQAIFYSSEQQLIKDKKPSPSESKAHFSVNYNNGHSELFIDETGETIQI